MSYVYIRSEPGLYTVGFYDPSGKWHSEMDVSDPQIAAERVAWLNGANPESMKRSGFCAVITEAGAVWGQGGTGGVKARP